MKNIISTRIRFARNIAGKKFLSAMTNEEKRALLLNIKETAKKLGEFDFIDMGEISDIRAGELVEKHLISPEFAEKRSDGGLLLGKDGITSIMINEEDHLRIQVIMPGFCVDEAFAKAKELEEKLDNALHFAYNDELGYLTHCPSNIGTAMRASVMVHLPALTESGSVGRLPSYLAQYGLTVRGLYGEGSRAGGAIYQISNQVSLGVTEEEITDRLKKVIEKVMESEEQIRKKLFSDVRIEDRVYRAVGTLSYARMLTSDEAMSLLSDLRFGIEAELTDISVETVDKLMNTVQPCSMEIIANGKNRDVVRAENIRNILTHK